MEYGPITEVMNMKEKRGRLLSVRDSEVNYLDQICMRTRMQRSEFIINWMIKSPKKILL